MTLNDSDTIVRINQLMDLALEHLNHQEAGQGLRAIDEALALGSRVRDLQHIRAICLVELGQEILAKTALEEELQHYPENTQAKDLHSQIVEYLETGEP